MKKKARWEYSKTALNRNYRVYTVISCSNCGQVSNTDYPYCPYCGRKMANVGRYIVSKQRVPDVSFGDPAIYGKSGRIK